jgi:AcrR family transcriptional regulator
LAKHSGRGDIKFIHNKINTDHRYVYWKGTDLARQSERREATRGALIKAARDCFVELGFDATSTEAVLARARVSKGALYHHFASKSDLLAAVFETLARETAHHAGAAAAGAGIPRVQLGMALKGWLRAALAPEPRRILLETGPAVLGLTRARTIEESVVQAPMRQMIASIIEQEKTNSPDIDLVARLLNSAVTELALTAVARNLDVSEFQIFDVYIDALIDALVS